MANAARAAATASTMTRFIRLPSVSSSTPLLRVDRQIGFTPTATRPSPGGSTGRCRRTARQGLAVLRTAPQDGASDDLEAPLHERLVGVAGVAVRALLQGHVPGERALALDRRRL